MYLRNILKEKELSYNEGFVSISLPVALYNYRVMDVRESASCSQQEQWDLSSPQVVPGPASLGGQLGVSEMGPSMCTWKAVCPSKPELLSDISVPHTCLLVCIGHYYPSLL